MFFPRDCPKIFLLYANIKCICRELQGFVEQSEKEGENARPWSDCHYSVRNIFLLKNQNDNKNTILLNIYFFLLLVY